MWRATWLAGGLLVWLLIGCGTASPPPTPTLEPLARAGLAVFTANCAICHALTPETVIRGPSLHGIATRAGTRVAGQDARTYLYSSILHPGDYLVDGFENLMPTTLGKDLTGEELDSVVAFLLTHE